MSSQVLECPLCTKPFGVTAEQAGQAVECPHCQQAVMVPELEAPPAPPQPDIMSCPTCDGQFGIVDEMRGTQVLCPHCQSPVMIPGNDTTAPMRPPSTAQPPKVVSNDEVKQKKKIKVRRRREPAEDLDDSELFAPGYVPKRKQESAQKPSADESTRPQSARESKKKTTSDAAPTPKKSRRPRPEQGVSKKPAVQTPAVSSEPIQRELPGAVNEPNQAPPEQATSTPPIIPHESLNPESANPKKENSSFSSPAGVAQFAEAEEGPQSEDVAKAENVFSPQNVDDLLPPKFDVIDPTLLAMRSGLRRDTKVILPDGKGGHSQIDSRIVTITHNGEEVELVALPPDELRKRRRIQNLVSILIGAIVLAVVFMLLRKTG